jgi:hypothetical protein
MSEAEVLIVGLLVAVAGLGGVARVLSVPYPVVLVLGGAVLGFVPRLPQVELDPDVAARPACGSMRRPDGLLGPVRRDAR